VGRHLGVLSVALLAVDTLALGVETGVVVRSVVDFERARIKHAWRIKQYDVQQSSFTR
jgi:hypothetical protein